MIFSETKLTVSDNSGAKKGKCIKIFYCSQKKGLPALGLSLISIRKIKINKNKVEKGKMYKSVLIRATKSLSRRNGVFLSFDSNDVILINDKNNPIASRIKGPIYKEFRSRFLSKVTILSNFSL